ncbi:MAG TPA: hypothetical protein P5260_12935 [Candidatus Competibacter sp.]|jgi:hypothetical protein|nr:hypothetical protein [Candidatus Competibacter sp.]
MPTVIRYPAITRYRYNLKPFFVLWETNIALAEHRPSAIDRLTATG